MNRTAQLFLFAIASTAIAPAQPPPGGSGDGVWLRDALFGENETFDSCLAHQPGQGMYHNHVQPICLRAQLGDNVELVATGRTGSIYREKVSGWKHSPILGWSYDGYPVYGPYGYSDPKEPNSPVKRMKSGFRVRNVAKRDSLPDWALGFHPGVPQQLPANMQGPSIDERFPLGRYLEDNEFVAGLGDLDQFNGRMTVTPEYPAGTYAYFITINADGSPAFPYIIGPQYFGVVPRTGPGPGGAQVPPDAQDYFANGAFTGQTSSDAQLATWQTKNSLTPARAIVGWDPSAGPQTTWPGPQPKGAMPAMGGLTTPANADIQRIRTTATAVYVNANDLASYVMGPWFAGQMNGGVFMNFPAAQNFQSQLPRSPQPAAAGSRTSTGLGAIGVLVNGVAIFNAADGASYSVARNDDFGGGLLQAHASHVSAASFEGGPVTPGALISAFAKYEAKLASSTDSATSPAWPTTLGGATVTITDSAGIKSQATISYASPSQINYRIPQSVATGLATVQVSASGITVPGALNIVPVYPGLFKTGPDNAAAAQVNYVANGKVTTSAVTGPISFMPGLSAALTLYGTGFNGATDVSATVGGAPVNITYAGPQGTYPGLDQINIDLPASLAGKGKLDIVITAGGKPSNPVNVVFQ